MIFVIWFVLQDAAGANVAAAIVGLGVLALGHTAAACRVDEVEGIVVVDAGHDAHMTDSDPDRESPAANG